MESKDPYYESKKKWQHNNVEKHKEACHKWAKNNPKRKAEIQRKYAKNNPNAIKAHSRANYHLKHLKKKGFVFHHKDYLKPLKVDIIPINLHQRVHTKSLNV